MLPVRSIREDYSSDESSNPSSILSNDNSDGESSFSFNELMIVNSSQDSNTSTDSGLDDKNDQNKPPAVAKQDVRRMKNRESAARSRMRIKQQLNSLENELNFHKEKNEELQNLKALLTKEVEQLESQMIALSLDKMKSSSHPLSELEDHKYIITEESNSAAGISIASH